MEYRVYEENLKRLHKISAEDAPAFYARLKYFRLNFNVPDVIKVGKGTRARYTINDIWSTSLLLKFDECGIKPQQSKALYDVLNIQGVRRLIETSTIQEDQYLIIQMYINSGKISDNGFKINFSLCVARELPEFIKTDSVLVINISNMIRVFNQTVRVPS